eukprot:4289437-Amphidinium_carterae.1
MVQVVVEIDRMAEDQDAEVVEKEMMKTMLLAIIQAAQQVRLVSGMDQDGTCHPEDDHEGA